MSGLWRAIDQSKGCHVVWSGSAQYLVTMTTGGYEMVVDLDAHKCAYKKWELSGIPCYHACACIAWSQKKFEPFIHQSYNKDIFLECYSNIVEPICGESEWEPTSFPKPLPPEHKVQPGRPKKKRNKASDIVDPAATRLKRQNTKIKCTYGTETSHNTCQARAVDRANGCERQVKTRTKSSKKSPCKKLDDAQGGANQSGGGHVSEGVETAKASAKTRKSIGEGTQGGVFRKKQPITKVVKNTPLGIQPQKTNTKSQGTATTMENIEARRRAMQANLRKNPVWKI